MFGILNYLSYTNAAEDANDYNPEDSRPFSCMRVGPLLLSMTYRPVEVWMIVFRQQA